MPAAEVRSSSLRLWSRRHVKQKPLAEFFQFLQCQLRMEVRERIGGDLPLKDPEAQQMWELYEQFVRPNLGKREKWMPFHTVLGSHELFVVKCIQGVKEQLWDSKRKFLVTFIFRAHCKSDFFEEAQLPHLQEEAFWENPISQFERGSGICQAMLEYRRKTHRPLQTGAFLSIPARLCADDDENLVVNIAKRTQILLGVAEDVWPVLNDSAKSATEKFEDIASKLRNCTGIGETWVKMLMVSIDIGNPKIRLLAERCEVGVGAIGGLRRLMTSVEDAKASLERVTERANRAKHVLSVSHFWDLLPDVERLARQKYADVPLVLEQMQTQAWNLPAVTVQVQLCEWRQFDDFLRKRAKREQQKGSGGRGRGGRGLGERGHGGRGPGRPPTKIRKADALADFEHIPDEFNDQKQSKCQRTSDAAENLGRQESEVFWTPAASSGSAASGDSPSCATVLDALVAENRKAKELADNAESAAQKDLEECHADCESASRRLQDSLSDAAVAVKEVTAAEERLTAAEKALDKAQCEQRACENTFSRLQAARRTWQESHRGEGKQLARGMQSWEQFPRHVKSMLSVAQRTKGQGEAAHVGTPAEVLEEIVRNTTKQAVSDMGEQLTQAADAKEDAGRLAKEASAHVAEARADRNAAFQRYMQMQHARLEAERDYRDAEQLVRVREGIVRQKHEEVIIVSIQAKHIQAASEHMLASIRGEAN